MYEDRSCFGHFEPISMFTCYNIRLCWVECIVMTFFGKITRVAELPQLLAHENVHVRSWAEQKLEELGTNGLTIYY